MGRQTMSTRERAPLELTRNSPCFCDSGQRFKHCCGASGPQRRIPHGIVVIGDFLSAGECADILRLADAQEADRLKLIDDEKTNDEQVVRKFSEGRITLRVNMTPHQAMLNTIIERAVHEYISPACGFDFDWFEEPQLLKYETGGFYDVHADNENFDPDIERWVHVVDRDISMLIYLDDSYTGGELFFANFDFRPQPTPGTLVFFPSDSRYIHAAMPVTSGTRHAIVSWLARRGVDKLRPPAPDTVKL